MNREEMAQSLISDKAFNDLLTSHLEYLKRYFKDPHEGFHPMLVFHGIDGKRYITLVGELSLDADERHKMFYNVCYGLAKKKELPMTIVSITMLCEAWVSGTKSKGEPLKLPVRDQPDKSEVIIASGITIDGRCNMAMFPMLRGTNNIVMLDEAHVVLSPYEKDDKKSMQSYILQEAYRGYVKGLQERT